MSSIYDKSSLVLIPSGTKTSKVYSQKPTNGDGDFDFTRSTAATRIAANGNIEKETQNLLLQSNTFSNASWNKIGGGAFTSGQSGYDGTNDAWQFDVTTTSNSGTWQNITLSGAATFSAYFKKGTIDKIGFTDLAGSTYMCWFDLTNGTIGQQTGDLIDAQIVSVGNGWYRCSITDIASGNNYLQLKPSNAYSGTSTAGNIYIQDAQLNQGLIAQEVITTTTTALYGGITDNVPRLDYTDSSCPALLLEPQRTNLISYSEYFEGSYWNTNSNALRSLSSNLSPEGTANAYRIEAVSGTQVGYVGVTTIGTTITHSLYVRRISGSTTFDMVDVNNVSTQVDITNDWKRFSVTASATSTNLRSYLRLNQIGDVVEIFGFQAEAGSYKTSYIPTYGTSVTRNADACFGAGDAATFNSTEGVLYAEISALANNGSTRTISINDNSGNNVVRIGYTATSNEVNFIIRATTNIYVYNQALSDTTTINKIAISYNSSGAKVFINGVLSDSGALSSLPTGLSQLDFRYGNGSFNFYGNTKQLIYFPTALSDSELATLTTI